MVCIKKNQFCVASFLSSQYWSVMYMYMLIIMTLQGDHVYNQQSIIRKSIHGLFLLIGTAAMADPAEPQ